MGPSRSIFEKKIVKNRGTLFFDIFAGSAAGCVCYQALFLCGTSIGTMAVPTGAVQSDLCGHLYSIGTVLLLDDTHLCVSWQVVPMHCLLGVFSLMACSSVKL